MRTMHVHVLRNLMELCVVQVRKSVVISVHIFSFIHFGFIVSKFHVKTVRRLLQTKITKLKEIRRN